MVKKQIAIVYVDNNKIYFWAKDLKNILQMDLPLDTVLDLEVISREKLEQLVDTFFQTYAIKGLEYEAVFVFSQNTTFEKDFPDDNSKTKHEEIQKFLDMVPFEDVVSNTYVINKKTKIIALNKVLYDVISEAFQKNKTSISLVLPFAILAETNPELATNLDLASIAARIDSFKKYSLLDVNESVLESEQKNSIGIKQKYVRVSALLGVFIVMFLILIFMIYTTFFSVPKTKIKPAVLNNIPVSETTTKETTSLSSESGKMSSPSSTIK